MALGAKPVIWAVVSTADVGTRRLSITASTDYGREMSKALQVVATVLAFAVASLRLLPYVTQRWIDAEPTGLRSPQSLRHYQLASENDCDVVGGMPRWES